MNFYKFANLENDKIINAEKKYGDYLNNALEANVLLEDFIEKFDSSAFLFMTFLTQVRIYHTLTIFSIIRQHHIQGQIDLRLAIESVVNACYALGHPKNQKDFVIEKDGDWEISKDLDKKRYFWLDKYSAQAPYFKNAKERINKDSAHSNLIYAFLNFGEITPDQLKMSFFDKDDDYLEKNSLWNIANFAIGALDLFYGVNKDYSLITFSKDFEKRLGDLEKENIRLKEEMMQHPRFKKTQKRENIK
jgi:hypothetical protein